MPAESINEPDDAFVRAIVAFDEAATVGQGLASSSDILNDPVQRERFERIKGTLDVLGAIWPRRLPSEASETLSLILGPLASEQGRFRIMRELGRGGWGIVFQAHDRVLGRQVALKVPRPEVLLTADNRKRFLKEAKIAAKLNHPSLIPIYDGGESGHFCYLVSAYCEGPTLAAWLRERTQPVPCSEAARLVAILAEAVDYMHSQGILHRDLKPSNILLASGEPASGGRKPPNGTHELMIIQSGGSRPPLADLQPKITDFGLAAFQECETMPTGLGGLTRTGALIGTPAYMAPEQADGRNKDIGPHTDVYALGVILYELLTGKPPFTGDSDVQTRLKVVSEEPNRPRLQRRDIPRDLETICLKCLEKTPARRYESAAALAADLNSFCQNRPIQARSVQAKRAAKKWVRRYGWAAFLLVNIGIIAWLLMINKPRERSTDPNPLAERLEYVRTVQKINQLAQNLLVPEAKEELSNLNGSRGFEVHLLEAFQTFRPTQVLPGHSPKEAWSAAFHPNGTLLATGGDDHHVRLWDTQTGAPRGILDGPDATVSSLAFSPDGKTLAGAGFDYHVTLWDMDSRKVIARLPHPDRVRSVVFSHDGRLLAACGGQHPGDSPCTSFRYLWIVAEKKLLQKREVITTIGSKPHFGLAFSKDHRELISVCADRAIHTWNLSQDSDQTIPTDSALYSLAISPTENVFATGDQAGRIRLWDLATGELRSTGSVHGSSIWCLAFTPDGKTIASASEDKLVRLWDVETMQPFYALDGHDNRVNTVSFSPDGSTLASVSHDGEVHIWRTGVPLVPVVGGKKANGSSAAVTSRLWGARLSDLTRKASPHIYEGEMRIQSGVSN